MHTIIIPLSKLVHLVAVSDGNPRNTRYTMNLPHNPNAEVIHLEAVQARMLMKAAGFFDIPIYDCPTTATGSFTCKF